MLRANPRGSTNYGLPFRAANLNDWGGGDYQDLMTGVDYVIPMGVADPNKLAVMGWSYGGYMTNWVVTQTNRFKCAATGAGTVQPDLACGEPTISPARWTIISRARGTSNRTATSRCRRWRTSQNVTTPHLILHGEADIRVPTSQGYEMYNALKRKGVPTEMVVYPRTPHGPQEPKFVLDIMQRHIDWVAKYLGD